jgi:hypothetical protein
MFSKIDQCKQSLQLFNREYYIPSIERQKKQLEIVCRIIDTSDIL